MNNKLLVSPAPHITKNYSTNVMMFAMLVALVPTTISGVITFGMRALYMIIISVVSAYIIEFLFRAISYKKVVFFDLSSLITGLVMALIMPVKAPLYFPVIGNIIALVIFKGFFGGLGKNIFNPAAAGRVILGLLFSALTLTMFTGTGLGENVASPLSYFMIEDYSSITIRSMFFGTASGAIGTVSIICILISGMFLMCFSITDYFIPVASIVTYVITVWLLKGPIAIVPYLFTGSFMFATMFMITDPTSSPTTTGGKFVYGLLFGVIAGLFRCFFVLGETSVFVAILCVNLLASLLDKIFAPRPLGVRRGK